MNEFVFTVQKQSDGRALYVKVSLEAGTGNDGYEFVFAARSDVPRDLVVAADRGAQYAWQHQAAAAPASGLTVRIRDIVWSENETTADVVAYATCYAVWGALGTYGVGEPRIGDV
jgi:hypothetical protein